jgi:hypothetical protein
MSFMERVQHFSNADFYYLLLVLYLEQDPFVTTSRS